MAGSLADPSPEQLEQAFSKYQTPEPPAEVSEESRAARLTPPPGRESTADEFLANFDKAAIERGYMEAPRPEPEPTEAEEQLQGPDHELFALHGTNVQELAGILEQNPDFAKLIGDEPARSPEEMARKVDTLLHLNEGQQARSMLEQERSEVELDDSLARLDEASEHWERVQAAEELARLAPARLGEFLAEWSEVEPLEASQYVAGKQQAEQAAYANLQALGNALALMGQAKEEAARQEAVSAAFEKAIGDVAGLLNPQGKEELGPDFAAGLQSIASSQEIDSPEMATAVTQMALSYARELREARKEAEVLTAVDERINRQNMGTPDWRPFDREADLARNVNKLALGSGERILQAGADAVAPRPKEKWLENLDAFVKGEKAIIDFGR